MAERVLELGYASGAQGEDRHVHHKNGRECPAIADRTSISASGAGPDGDRHTGRRPGVCRQEAYTKGDYEAAFKGFRELAELGQAMAQSNLAVMYAKGQGTRQSEIYAYAWASLAAKNGLEQAQPMVHRLVPQLALAPGSDQIAKDIEAQYGNAVLDQRLFPRLAAETATRSRGNAVIRCTPTWSTIR
jgi:TPR repeat protein